MNNRLSTTLAAAALVAPLAIQAQEGIDIERVVDERYAETVALASALWDFAEVGYREAHSSALL